MEQITMMIMGGLFGSLITVVLFSIFLVPTADKLRRTISLLQLKLEYRSRDVTKRDIDIKFLAKSIERVVSWIDGDLRDLTRNPEGLGLAADRVKHRLIDDLEKVRHEK